MKNKNLCLGKLSNLGTLKITLLTFVLALSLSGARAGDGTLDTRTNNYAYYKSSYTLGDSQNAFGTIRFDNLTLEGDSVIGIKGPIDGTLHFNSDAYLTLLGDLVLGSKTAITAGGNFTIRGGNNSIILNGNLTLPAYNIFLDYDGLVINGGGNTLTFVAGSSISSLYCNITMKNMIIKGLSGIPLEVGGSHVTPKVIMQNCIIDIPSGTTWGFQDKTQILEIIGNVIIRGGGTFKLDVNSKLTIKEHSNLTIDSDTTFEYGAGAGTLTMDDASSSLHFNGATLKLNKDLSPATSGTLIFEDSCTLDGGNKLTLPSTLTAKVLASARVNVIGATKIDIS